LGETKEKKKKIVLVLGRFAPEYVKSSFEKTLTFKGKGVEEGLGTRGQKKGCVVRSKKIDTKPKGGEL